MFVLLIEDEPELRDIAETVLEDAGMLVVTAADGARALRLVQRIRPDVIVTDMMMPTLDGFGFLARYAELGEKRAPVIATSSFKPYLERATSCGASAVLAKPYTPAALVESVRHAAAERQGEARPTDAAPRSEPADASAMESARLRAICDLRLDEAAPEQRLHEFVAQVAAHFEVPIALITVVDAELAYWTAGFGLPRAEIGKSYGGPRRLSFCTHAVAARAALVVQDTAENPFFRDNPIMNERGLRFYAGVPLLSRHHAAVGTLCLLDIKPRPFTHFDLELLSLFANRVLCALEWREKRRAPEIPDSAFRYLQYYDEELGVFGRAAFGCLTAIEAARASEQHQPLACVAVAVPHRRLAASAEALLSARPKTLVGRLGHSRLGWLAPGLPAAEARRVALEAVGDHAFAEAVPLDCCTGATSTMLEKAEAALGDAGLA
jgi:CheY-like chemotaxis protein/GAF domain-containing protein